MAPAIVLRGERWRVLTDPAGTVVPRSVAIQTTVAGMALNVVLPARLGELGRVLLLHRRCGVSRILGLAATAAERLLDLAALALLVLVVAPVTCRSRRDPRSPRGLDRDLRPRRRRFALGATRRRACRGLPERSDPRPWIAVKPTSSRPPDGPRGPAAGGSLRRVLLLSVGSWMTLAVVDLARCGRSSPRRPGTPRSSCWWRPTSRCRPEPPPRGSASSRPRASPRWRRTTSPAATPSPPSSIVHAVNMIPVLVAGLATLLAMARRDRRRSVLSGDAELDAGD